MKRSPALVLASGSPRRRDLLRKAGYRFRVVVSNVHERPPRGAGAGRAAVEIARRKANATAALLSGSGTRTPRPCVVLAADTIVTAKGRMLGKAASRAHAKRMLRLLSGAAQDVYTGVALLRLPERKLVTFHVRTRIVMREWTPEEIEDYLDSGEWEGKAGAYAIQETADRFIIKMTGSRTNVVGLPMERVSAALASLGVTRYS
jgi:septum formation protein